jgi:predicted NBD/HSP70 family sugar kinase
VDLRHGDWRIAACALDGSIEPLHAASHAGVDPAEVIRDLGSEVARARRRLRSRLIGVGVTVPGQTAGTRLLYASMLGWRDLELTPIATAARVPLNVGNDATMAAVAEARVHRARVLLHVVVEIGVGGALMVDGRPLTSARGLHGEFGHMPFGDPAERCRCGANGCWEIPFVPRNAAASLGRRAPRDPRSWLARLLCASALSADERELRESLGARLGRGCAGLVNALDPDLVTLGGLAGAVRSAAAQQFDRAFAHGLMAAHRAEPPSVITAHAGEDAALVGAGLSAFDEVLDAASLARWAGSQ